MHEEDYFDEKPPQGHGIHPMILFSFEGERDNGEEEIVDGFVSHLGTER